MTAASPNNVEDLIEHIITVLNESGIEQIEDDLQKLHPADRSEEHTSELQSH